MPMGTWWEKDFKSPIYKLRIEYIDDICVKTETLNFKNKQLWSMIKYIIAVVMQ